MTGMQTTINDNGAWCWFQDERALVDPANNTLLVGSVAAPEGAGGDSRGGNIEVAVLDLATGDSQVHVVHRRLEPDDHNAPALLIRPDGRYLAMYAKHKTDNYSRWRISTRPHDASEWGPEGHFDWTGAGRRPRRNLLEPAPARCGVPGVQLCPCHQRRPQPHGVGG